MKIQYFSKAEDLLAKTGQQLSRDEARYGLMLMILKSLVGKADIYKPGPPWFCAVYSGKTLCAAALRTPPFKVVLAHLSGDAQAVAGCLVDTVSQRETAITGINGDKELADRFAELWCRSHPVTVQSVMGDRIYRLDQVNDVALAPGRLRQATEADKGLVARWSHSFFTDIFGKSSNEIEIDITPNLIQGDVYLWDDREPVSLVMKSRLSEKSMMVRFVYTPPEQRGKGYSTSTVSELCRQILKSGCQFCSLFADPDNPISNSIYQKIGFYAVSDSISYAFSL
jgi:uncharacterized protein